MQNIDIDTPLQTAGNGNGTVVPEASQEEIAMLADMGFTASQAKKALRETVSSVHTCRNALKNGVFLR